jgi:glycosyltransferase involved in cell wall biosynthesis
MSKLSSQREDLQFVLCGFDTRGTITEINQQTGEQKQRPIKPEETVWVKYEEIVTDKYFGLSDDYIKHLKKFKEEEYPNEENELYRRVWTRPVTSYAKNYSKFDVSLAPIKNHIFNRMKSQLKVIEAGFYKKALIASEVGPYTIDLKHALNNGNFTSDGNALLVDENRNHSDWFKFIKKLNDNRNLVVDLGERLYETVKDTYDLNVVTKNRREFYLSIVK